MNNLKIIHFNANGITHKINELKAFISKLNIDFWVKPAFLKKPVLKFQTSTHTAPIFPQYVAL